MFLLFMLLAWITGACALIDEDLSDVGEPRLTLAMSVKDMKSGPDMITKMSPSITQSSGTSFRGIEEVYVIPFHTEMEISEESGTKEAKPVTAGDTRQGKQNVSISGPTIAPTSLDLEEEKHLARLFERAFVPLATNRVLVYGEARKSYTEATKVNKHKHPIPPGTHPGNPQRR